MKCSGGGAINPYNRIYSTQVLEYHHYSMAQVKFVIDDELLKKFKQIVIKRRGKIELTPEGEDAIRLYIEKYGSVLDDEPRRVDPLRGAIGVIHTGKDRNALKDLKELEAQP
jgi:hypothetical protein